VEIDDASEEQSAVEALELADISDTTRIGLLSGEVVFYQICSGCCVGLSTSPAFPAVRSDKASIGH